MMENMIMDQVLGSALLTKLQAMHSQPYDIHQQAGCHNYMGPSPSVHDIHIHDHIHHDALLTQQALYHSMGAHSMLPGPPSSPPSPLPPQDAVVDYLLANPAFPYTICKQEEKEEEEELMLVSSLPSCHALLGARHSLLGTNDTHDFDSSYSTLLHYASGGSGRYSPDLSSSYSTPLGEHVQCTIDPSPSSRRYGSQASHAYTCLASPDFSCLLKQSTKDEANCIGIDVQECNGKEASKDALSCIMHASNPCLALSASSSSTPTSMTSTLPCHSNLQANWMPFDDHYNSTNPTSHHHNNGKLLHMSNNMVNDGGDHNGGVSASITSNEKKKKRKRKRTSHKNVQEMESQRMTHIAVERNRRKQMNEHLRALRLLMPHSYIQRGDQASIVGGTIRFVEELEQVLQALRLQKQIRSHQECKLVSANIDDFGAQVRQLHKHVDSLVDESYASTRSCLANVEVTMMTSSTFFVKVLAQKRPHQLLHILLAFANISLKVVHLNVTATQLIILYCFNLEMEDDCQLHTPNELAESIQQFFCM